jgi:hypothetical protein
MVGTKAGCRATANGKVYAYRRYVCSGNLTRGILVCPRYSIREDALLPFLVRKLQEDYLAAEKLEVLETELRRRLEARRRGQGLPEAERLRARLADLDEQIRAATLNVLRAKHNLDLLNEALTGLREERDRLALELQDAEARKEPELDVEAVVEEAVGRLRTLGERLDETDPTRLREVLRQMIERIDLYYEEPPERKAREWFRLERGVVRLRPQLQFEGCALSAPRSACPPAAS